MVWVAGYTSNGDLAARGSAFQAATGGGTNIFLARINPKGELSNSLLYFTYIGGSGTDMPNAMAMDSAGFIFLAGGTTSTNFPLSGNVNQTTNNGRTQALTFEFCSPAPGAGSVICSALNRSGPTERAFRVRRG